MHDHDAEIASLSTRITLMQSRLTTRKAEIDAYGRCCPPAVWADYQEFRRKVLHALGEDQTRLARLKAQREAARETGMRAARERRERQLSEARRLLRAATAALEPGALRDEIAAFLAE